MQPLNELTQQARVLILQKRGRMAAGRSGLMIELEECNAA